MSEAGVFDDDPNDKSARIVNEKRQMSFSIYLSAEW